MRHGSAVGSHAANPNRIPYRIPNLCRLSVRLQGGPSAIVAMSSPFLAGTGMAPRGPGRADRTLLGQQRCVRLLSSHARPGPASCTSSRRALAGGSGTGHAHAVSCVRGQAGDRRQNAPSLSLKRPRILGETPGMMKSATHYLILRKCCVPDRAVRHGRSRSLADSPARIQG